MMNRLFDFMVYYLPVFVPFLLAMFSVVVRILSETMKLDLRSVLKTYMDIALGIVSFLIWALITLTQTGQIALNPDLVISPGKLLVLLMLDLALLFTAAVVSRLKWQDSRVAWSALRKERYADTFMIFLTVAFFLLPLSLTSPAKASRPQVAVGRYTVIVPYEDPTIPRHVGVARWAGRQLCEVDPVVEAQNEQKAKEIAIGKFRQSGRSLMMYSKGPEPEQVSVLQDFVLARAHE